MTSRQYAVAVAVLALAGLCGGVLGSSVVGQDVDHGMRIGTLEAEFVELRRTQAAGGLPEVADEFGKKAVEIPAIRTQSIVIVDKQGRDCGVWHAGAFGMNSPYDEGKARGEFTVLVSDGSAILQLLGTANVEGRLYERAELECFANTSTTWLKLTRGHRVSAELVTLPGWGRFRLYDKDGKTVAEAPRP